jgi:hypothetical protein
MKDGFPVSVAELIAAGARPFPGETVAILLDVCEQGVRQPPRGAVLPAITPSALYVDGSGTVALAGGVPVEDDQTVQLLGRLLAQMLPAPGTVGASRVPSRLRDLATRAAAGELRRLSVARLAASLRRFAPENPQMAVRDLFERWRKGAATSPAVHAPWPSSHTPVTTPITLDAQEDVSPARPTHQLRRRLVGALVATTLVLASIGAAYWLNADTVLPPLPLSPTLLSDPPKQKPSRDGWELLDPAALAVDARPVRADDATAPPAKAEKSPPAAQVPPPPPPQRPTQ